MKKRYWKLPLKRETRTLSPSPKKNEWVKKVGKEGSLRMDGLRLKKKMTNHKKHNNITQTKRWEEMESSTYTELCKNIPARFGEWLAEILRHRTMLGWAAEHFESDSQNLAWMFYRTMYCTHLIGKAWACENDPSDRMLCTWSTMRGRTLCATVTFKPNIHLLQRLDFATNLPFFPGNNSTLTRRPL